MNRVKHFHDSEHTTRLLRYLPFHPNAARAELLSTLSMTYANFMELAKKLTDEHILQRTHVLATPENPAGKSVRPAAIRLDDEYWFSIGFLFRTAEAVVVLTDISLNLLEQKILPYRDTLSIQSRRDIAESDEIFGDIVANLLDSCSISSRHVAGAGLAVMHPVLSPDDFRPMQRTLKERFAIPSYADSAKRMIQRADLPFFGGNRSVTSRDILLSTAFCGMARGFSERRLTGSF